MKRAILLPLLLLCACLRKPDTLRNEARAILDEEVECADIGAGDLICRGKVSRRAMRCDSAKGCEPLMISPCLQVNLPAEQQ